MPTIFRGAALAKWLSEWNCYLEGGRFDWLVVLLVALPWLSGPLARHQTPNSPQAQQQWFPTVLMCAHFTASVLCVSSVSKTLGSWVECREGVFLKDQSSS